MTQARILLALQDGPKTSHEIAEITGMTQATVISTARKLRTQGKITSSLVKSGKYHIAQFTLTEEKVYVSDNGVKIICGIPTYGIFTPAEYRVMNAQARKLNAPNPQFTTYSKAKPSENNRQV